MALFGSQKRLAPCGLIAAVCWTALTPALSARGDEPTQPEMTPEVEQLLRQCFDRVAAAKAFRVTIAIELSVLVQDVQQRMPSRAEFYVARPNRLALRNQEGAMSLDTVTDGQQLYRGLAAMKRYTLAPATDSLEEIFSSEAFPGMGMMGPEVIAAVLAAKQPYEALLIDVEQVKDLGPEKIGDQECRHLRLIQKKVDLDLWIAVGEELFLRQASPNLLKLMKAQFGGELLEEAAKQLEKMKMDLTLGFLDWNLAAEFSEATFAIEPPADWKKVDSLLDGLGGQPEGPHPLLGLQAPDFKAERLDGDPVSLDDHRGKEIVVLDFWATWCGPCVDSLPKIAAAAAEYADKGVVFYAVNEQESADEIRQFLADQELDLPVLLDTDGKIGEQYQASGIPQTVLVGKDGIVQVVHVGASSNIGKTIKRQLDDLLAGKNLAEEAKQAAAERESAEDAAPFGLTQVWSQLGNWQGVAAGNAGEILVAAPGRLARFDAAGQKLGQVDVDSNESLLRRAQLIGDDASEVLVFSAWGQAVEAFDLAGTRLWSFEGGQGIDDVFAADLNGDGLDEVVVGYNGATGVKLLDNTGKELWKDASIGNVWYVAAGRLDADTPPVVVTSSAAGQVHIFSHLGDKLRDIVPGFYGHMVCVRPAPVADGAMIVVGGSREDMQGQLAGLTATGETRWTLELTSGHANSAQMATDRPWLAVSFRGGGFQVVDIDSGALIGRVAGKGPSPAVAWQSRTDAAPLLVVATGRAVEAYEVTPEEPAGESR